MNDKMSSDDAFNGGLEPFESSGGMISSAGGSGALESDLSANEDMLLVDDEDLEYLNSLVNVENDSNDVRIHGNSFINLFRQDENVLSVELENFYKNDEGDIRNQFSLLREPPVLKISSSDGSEASFALTKNFTEDLVNILKNVNSGYYGIQENNNFDVSDKNIKNKIVSLKNYVLEHKVVSLIILGLIVFMIIGL